MAGAHAKAQIDCGYSRQTSNGIHKSQESARGKNALKLYETNIRWEDRVRRGSLTVNNLLVAMFGWVNILDSSEGGAKT